MSKRMITAVLALALAVGGSSLALARSSHKVKLTSQLASVSTAGNKIVDAGTVSGTYGSGAIVVRSTVSATAIAFKTTVWYVKGTINAKGTLQVAPQPDGSTAYTGTAKATGGTGRFKAVRGTIKITGTSPPNDTVHATLTATGTLKY
jgi:hypothetical protein